MPKEYMILKNDEGTRKIFVVNNWPFYESTGESSGQGGTCFPFVSFSNGKLEKAESYPEIGFRVIIAHCSQLIKANFPAPLAKKMLETETIGASSGFPSTAHKFKPELMIRFGNIKGMILSMYIGGGFWASTKGNELKLYIEKNYSEYCQLIQEKYKDEIAEAKRIISIDTNSSEATSKTTEDTRSVNQFLINQGVAYSLEEANLATRNVVNEHLSDILQEVKNTQDIAKRNTNASPSSTVGAPATTKSSNAIPCISFAGRHFIAIGGFPFYCSSGESSGQSGTYFPFNGILGDLVCKPFNPVITNPLQKNAVFKNAIGPYFPDDVIDLFYNSKLGSTVDCETLAHFGNMETLVISMLIGGGFWEDNNSYRLKHLITNKYKKFYDEVKQKYETSIEMLKILQDSGSEISEVKAPAEINQFLRQQIPTFVPHGEESKSSEDFSVNKHAESYKQKCCETSAPYSAPTRVPAPVPVAPLSKPLEHPSIAAAMNTLFNPSSHTSPVVNGAASTPPKSHAASNDSEAANLLNQNIMKSLIECQTRNFKKGEWRDLIKNPKIEVGVSRQSNMRSCDSAKYKIALDGNHLIVLDKTKKDDKGNFLRITDERQIAQIISETVSIINKSQPSIYHEAHLWHIVNKLAQAVNNGNGPNKNEWKSLDKIQIDDTLQFSEAFKAHNWEFGLNHTGNLAFTTVKGVTPGYHIELLPNGNILIQDKNNKLKPILDDKARSSILGSLSNNIQVSENVVKKSETPRKSPS